ncbi:Fe(3+)-hydroxamate ABC transporter permease FhuB [Atopomonas sediminilitoris]|uniref:Fe(3+)-hydroxamate ABC transporter permease FhuB n=1 Tax=Atopomonas sediminilitoris TaxID=2919919 RepID=UPI001F4EAD57|nr:Fe(3+)-hydroxamate ABC transporter permease FhuB [Atopomonas sediminilitoris]MCJ8170011.1 Fe(3+)-hydroxamate ABC transporter permease FhuB [Atopomonas sediminilitoris]
MNTRARLPLYAATLTALCFALVSWQLSQTLPWQEWWHSAQQPNPDDYRQLLLWYSLLPRLCASLLAGAGLALSGIVLQQVLRNPIASPSTLGIAGGAQLAMAAGGLFLPAQLAPPTEWLAMLGGLAALSLVLTLAWGKQLSPLAVILAGLVVGLYCGALNGALILLHEQRLSGLFLWGAGSLNQQDWQAVQFLWPRLLIGASLLALLARPLSLLSLQDAQAQSLGVPLLWLRLAALLCAVWLCACVISSLGVFAFIGLAGPAMARLLGARKLWQQLLWAPACGALLLTLTDQLLQWGEPRGLGWLPTGAATALIGAPLLLWLLPKVRALRETDENASISQRQHPGRWPRYIGVLLLLSVVAALLIGRGQSEWLALDLPTLQQLLPWRLPRVLGALAAGILLALAGCVLQRLAHNPLASPEVLGISAGSALGLIALVLLVPNPARGWQLLAAACGAALSLALLLHLSRRAQYSPQRLLLAGIALAALLDAILHLLLASGDPRLMPLLYWLAGSTYYTSIGQSLALLALAGLLALLCWAGSRWLNLLSLGAETAQGLGLNLAKARLGLLTLAATLTAGATLLIGPLSFIGLMAPHMARLLGAQQVRAQLLLSALIGALLMVLADWLGRNLLYPFQLPAGLLATLVGGLYFLFGLRRSGQ